MSTITIQPSRHCCEHFCRCPTSAELEVVMNKNTSTTQPTASTQALQLLARVAMAALFLIAGYRKFADWQNSVAFFGKIGLPMPELTLALVLVIEILGAIALILGWRLAFVSAAMAVYTMATALVAHQFWVADAAQYAGQLNNFLKNLAIAGGFVYMADYARYRANV